MDIQSYEDLKNVASQEECQNLKNKLVSKHMNFVEKKFEEELFLTIGLVKKSYTKSLIKVRSDLKIETYPELTKSLLTKDNQSERIELVAKHIFIVEEMFSKNL